MKECYRIAGSVKKNTESKNSKVVRTQTGRIKVLSKCV